jgi:PAS domain S-box-containing protein
LKPLLLPRLWILARRCGISGETMKDFNEGNEDAPEQRPLSYETVLASITSDIHGVITSWNIGAERIFGYTEAEAIGHHFTMLVPVDKLPEAAEIGRVVRSGRKIVNWRTRRRRKEGDEIMVTLSISPILDLAKETVGFNIRISHLANEHGVVAEDTENANVAREAMLKRSILDVVTHELKTPLARILGMNELLLDSGLNEDQKYLARAVNDAAEDLLQVVNDFIDAADIQTGRICITNSEFDIEQLVQELSAEFGPAAHQKQLQFDVSVDEEIREPIWADRRRLRTILRQLVSNAVKFTVSGGVTVKARFISFERGVEYVQFSVEDTGPGFPENFILPRGQPFGIGDASNRRKHSGNGLGLMIAKGLIELMGGSMYIDSNAGTGTRVSFLVPFRVS